MKNFLQSKRFWAGLIALLTGLSLIFTGEKSFEAVLPELLLTGIGLVQTIIALISTKQVVLGRVK